jgi:hypothetical protein
MRKWLGIRVEDLVKKLPVTIYRTSTNLYAQSGNQVPRRPYARGVP